MTSSAPGTAVYTITPVSPDGCVRSSAIVVVYVEQYLVNGHTHFRGEIKFTQFATQADIVHVLT